MKVVLQEAVREDAKYYCDSCGIESFSELVLHSWYGSKNDLTKQTCHLCDECWDKVRSIIEEGYGFHFKKEDVLA